MQIQFSSSCAPPPQFGTAQPQQRGMTLLPLVKPMLADKVTFSGTTDADARKAAAETFLEKLDVPGLIAEMTAQQPGAQAPSKADLDDFLGYFTRTLTEEYTAAELKEMTEDVEQNRISKEEKMGFIAMALMSYVMEMALGSGFGGDGGPSGAGPFGGQF